MARKTLNIDLSVKSLDDAIRYLENYELNFNAKLKRFLERLGDIGIHEIDSRMAGITGDSDLEHYAYIKVNQYGEYAEATLVLQGKDIAFIEFGAGIHYNGSVGSAAYDWAAQHGYTIGSYGKGQGAKDYWFYEDESGVSNMSQGTQAAKPLYSAEQKIKEQVRSIAKEVFGS